MDWIDDENSWEADVLPRLAEEAFLLAKGFWQPMDTLRDKPGSKILELGKPLEALVMLTNSFWKGNVCLLQGIQASKELDNSGFTMGDEGCIFTTRL